MRKKNKDRIMVSVTVDKLSELKQGDLFMRIKSPLPSEYFPGKTDPPFGEHQYLSGCIYQRCNESLYVQGRIMTVNLSDGTAGDSDPDEKVFALVGIPKSIL